MRALNVSHPDLPFGANRGCSDLHLTIPGRHDPVTPPQRPYAPSDRCSMSQSAAGVCHEMPDCLSGQSPTPFRPVRRATSALMPRTTMSSRLRAASPLADLMGWRIFIATRGGSMAHRLSPARPRAGRGGLLPASKTGSPNGCNAAKTVINPNVCTSRPCVPNTGRPNNELDDC